MSDPVYQARRQAVAAGLARHRLDALLVVLSPNLRYLSGFTGSNANLLLSAQHAILFTDPRYQIQAHQECTRGQGGAGARGSACEVRIVKGPLVPAVASTIARLRWKRIGYEPSRMTCDVFEALKNKLPMRASLEPCDGLDRILRMIKSPAEIDLIRRSVQTNSRAFEQAVARVASRHEGERPGCGNRVPHAPPGGGEAVV